MALVFGHGVYNFESPTNNNFTRLKLAGVPLPTDTNGLQFHASFFTVKVAGKSVICLQSNFHPKLDTMGTSIFFEKIVGADSSQEFEYLVTSGTSGGIWQRLDLGDVVVTNAARYGLSFPVEKQSQHFAGTPNILGSNPPGGYATWYDYVSAVIIQVDNCVATGLTAENGRKTSAKPAIYYKPNGTDVTDVVTDTRINQECSDVKTYRTMGATLDENDAFVAEACQAVGFANWISIRNVSDLPCGPTGQYDKFQYCSSINGAYAVWAFIMGH
jgi:nucleoside phosphorylase